MMWSSPYCVAAATAARLRCAAASVSAERTISFGALTMVLVVLAIVLSFVCVVEFEFVMLC